MGRASPERQREYHQRRKARGRQNFVAGDLSTLTPEQCRAHLAELSCPWCAFGPFRNLGVHLYKAHGVTSREFKDHALLPQSTPTTDPETSARLRELWEDGTTMRVPDNENDNWREAIRVRDAHPTTLQSRFRTAYKLEAVAQVLGIAVEDLTKALRDNGAGRTRDVG